MTTTSQYLIHDGAVFQITNIQAPPRSAYSRHDGPTVYTLTPAGGGVPVFLRNPTMDQIRLVPMCDLCGTAAGSRCWSRENGEYVNPPTCTDTTAALYRRAGIAQPAVVHSHNVETDGYTNGDARAWCPCGFQGEWTNPTQADVDASRHAA